MRWDSKGQDSTAREPKRTRPDTSAAQVTSLRPAEETRKELPPTKVTPADQNLVKAWQGFPLATDQTHPTLRANPFPEVTDLFCRLPLSTLFYQLEAIHLGDLMRLWVQPSVRINRSLGFSRIVMSAPDILKTEYSTKLLSLALGNPKFQGERRSLLRRKENSSQDSSQCLQVHLCCHLSQAAPERTTSGNPHLGSRILTGFPFDRRGMKYTKSTYQLPHFNTELPYLLGLTNPWPNTVPMEPFSTSVFKVLIWIFATTTKICTRGCFTRDYSQSFFTSPHACLLIKA